MLKVELIGNLGADVEVKESNGSKFATFRIADTSRYKTQSGEDKEVTNWIDCSYNNVTKFSLSERFVRWQCVFTKKEMHERIQGIGAGNRALWWQQ